MWHLEEKWSRIISNSAYCILRTLVARGRRVVTTKEIREAVGFDPHPMLGGISSGAAGPIRGIAPPCRRNAGVQITELGEAAFELGRLAAEDKMPVPVGGSHYFGRKAT